jgi:hypothetical protein
MLRTGFTPLENELVSIGPVYVCGEVEQHQ